MDREREALRRLLGIDASHPTGEVRRRQQVALRVGASPDYLYQVATGIKLKSGKERTVGRLLREKLNAAYPNWLAHGIHAAGIASQEALGRPPVTPPPPSPGPRFADRHEVSESDFALLQDIKTAMESPRLAAQVEELRREAQAMEAFAAKHYGPKG